MNSGSEDIIEKIASHKNVNDEVIELAILTYVLCDDLDRNNYIDNTKIYLTNFKDCLIKNQIDAGEINLYGEIYRIIRRLYFLNLDKVNNSNYMERIYSKINMLFEES